jgi:hypothetical protein
MASFWTEHKTDDDDGDDQDDSQYDPFWRHVRQEARRCGLKPPRPFTAEYLAQLERMLHCTPPDQRRDSSKFCQVCFEKRPQARNTQGVYCCRSCVKGVVKGDI